MSKLHLLTLPIGNLEDLTQRVLNTLKVQREFFAEDTRSFRELLTRLDLPVSEYRVSSYHDQSQEKTERLIRVLNSNQDLYYVSEAGSPVISDPAYPLIRMALENNHELITYPGVCAPVVALELSGLPPHPFSFHGFLPREESKKKTFFLALEKGQTHIFFEGLSRVEKTLSLFGQVFPNAKVVVARELTKKFEQVLRFKASDWENVKEALILKGEFVLLIYLEKTKRNHSGVISEEVKQLASSYLERPTTKGVAKIISMILDQKSGDIYKAITANADKKS